MYNFRQATGGGGGEEGRFRHAIGVASSAGGFAFELTHGLGALL